MAFDYSSVLRGDLPPPVGKWSGFPEFNFVGGNVDAEVLPVDGLIEAVTNVLRREGSTLATYNLESGALGYRPLREFIAAKLKEDNDQNCDPDEILVTSGSLQCLDLVNEALLSPGDTVIVEEATYGGALTRLNRLGVKHVGVQLDDKGIDMDALEATLSNLRERDIRPKFIYTIPTVQNPTGSIMPTERRRKLLELSTEYGIPIFEDDCYADLTWDGTRPPAIHALDKDGRVIYCGSFSKTVSPALRVGFITAPWELLSRLVALKTDAGSSALPQMALAEYSPHFLDSHIGKVNTALKAKRDLMIECLNENFGASADFPVPEGGIVLWVTLPDNVDTSRLAAAAAAEGIAINPGAEWMSNGKDGIHKLRLCYANPTDEAIRKGIAKLADVCHREFGVPIRSANVTR